MSRLHKWIHHPITARFLVTLLISWGLANVCCISFFPAPHLGSTFLWCGLFALLFALYNALRFRWKPLLILIALGGLTALGVVGHTGPVHSLMEGVKAFLYMGQGWTEILTLYADLLLPLLCLILAMVAQACAADENGLLAAFFTLAACAILFMLHPQPPMLAAALPAFGGLALQWTRKQHFHILSVPIVALLVLIAYLITPQAPATSPDLEKTAKDVRQTIEDYLLFTSKRDSFSLAAEGYMPLENRLGGKPELTDRPVMDVETEETVLLRGKTYDQYTGLGWVDSLSSKRYLYYSLYNQDLRTRLFALDQPLADSQMLPSASLQIHLLSDGTTTLFAPAYTRKFSLQSQRMVLYFNTSAELFLTRNTNSLDHYSLSYVPLQAGHARTAQIVEACASMPDPYYSTVASQYLTLPEHILSTADLKNLAGQAADTDASPYEKALQLQAYLQKNYPYSLDVNDPPVDVDFVSYFLLGEKKGYCTYFASAMTVLCRMHGIPARYVTGYLAQPGEDGIAHVLGKNAHAWTEIYLNGVGWLPIDATGQAQTPDPGNTNPPPGGSTLPTPSPSPLPSPSPQPTAVPTTTPSPTAVPSDEPTASPSGEPQSSPPPSPRPSAVPSPAPNHQEDRLPDGKDDPFSWWWILVLLLLIALLALWYVLSLPETRAKRKRADAAGIYYTAMEGILALMHVRRAPSQTLHSFADNVYAAGQSDAARAIQAYAAHLYGKDRLPEETFAACYKALFARLSLPRKILFRLQGMVKRKKRP